MSKQQQSAATKNMLAGRLNSAAAALVTPPVAQDQSPIVNNGITKEINKTVITEGNKEINTVVVEESVKRGAPKKGEFKKVTLNLDVELNTQLDQYILTLKQKALKEGTEAPNKSEWVRNIVEEKLRELGAL